MTKPPRLLPFLGLLSISLALAGCENRPPVAPTPTTPHFSAETTKNWKVPTDAQAEAFARQLETAIETGDVAKFNALIDWTALLERSASALPISAKQRALRAQGAQVGLEGAGGLGTKLVEAAKRGGSYRLVRVHSKGDKKYALFRMLHPDAGLNYHNLLLTSQGSRGVRAPDIFVFLSGETLSDTVHRMLLLQLSTPTLHERLTGRDRDLAQHAAELNEMSQATTAGDFQRAMKIYEAFPQELRDDKGPALMYMQAAQQSGSVEKYLKFLDDWRKRFPDDVSGSLMALDAYLLKKQYDKAFDAIDQLDVAIGTDPYLDVLRGNVAYEAGDVPKAKAYIQQAIAAKLNLAEPYWQLLAISASEKDFDETVRLLNFLTSEFKQQFGDLTKVPQYAEFVKSPQYAAWIVSQK